MPVTNRHKQYLSMAPLWRRVRDVLEGSDTVKNRNIDYLPRLGLQKEVEYQAYKTRANFYGATSRSVDGVCGMVFRKNPTIGGPDQTQEIIDRASGSVGRFVDVCRLAFYEVVALSRFGLLVDMPKKPINGISNPYLIPYQAEDIINWKWTMVNGEPVTSMVVLEERYDVDGPDLFTSIEKVRYRVLFLDNGIYRQQVWEEVQALPHGKTELVVVKDIVPNVMGVPFKSLPFQFFGGSGGNPTVEIPTILDMVDLNLSHYRTSADLEHGRHFTALPTPWAVGFPTQDEYHIGSSVAWVSSDPSARAGFLEFSGAGLASLERAQEEKEKKMSSLFSRMLEGAGPAETATAVSMRHAGEQGVIQALANDVSLGLTQCAKWIMRMSGVSSEETLDTVEVLLNTELVSIGPDTALLDALIRAMQAGAMRKETVIYQMSKMGLLPPGTDYQQEVQELAAVEVL
jgi:hypothetical protein